MQPLGDKYQLQGFGPGTEEAVILFPHTCVSRKLKQFGVVDGLDVMRDSIEVDVVEDSDHGSARVNYVFDGNLTLKRVIYSDLLKELHDSMAAKKELDHLYSDSEEEQLYKDIKILKKNGKTRRGSGSGGAQPLAR